MNARTGDLTARPQPGQAGGPVEVGDHPPADVVGGRGDGQPVPAGVEADASEGGSDGRKALVEVLQVGDVEPEVGHGLFRHRGRHGPAELVPGDQLVDEALTAGVAHHRAVAPEGFGEQGPGRRGVVQGGGVELHELDVGHRHPGPQGHGQPVAR